MRDLRCLRCQGRMGHVFTEHIQLGKTSMIFGDWPNLLAGALLTEVYCCKNCGRLEFFAAEPVDDSPELPQVICPVCGRSHDFDFPSCPFCKHNY